MRTVRGAVLAAGVAALLVSAVATSHLAAAELAGNASPAAERGLTNLARGKPYTLTPPNYQHCTDPGDRTQLTDGAYSQGYFWTQKTTVGWGSGAPAIITIDLGREEPIRGLSFSTAAGVAGVDWPLAILVYMSPDGKAWHEAGDLVPLAARKAQPPAQGYTTHVFWTDEMPTRGRYVAVAAVPTGPYLFVDEIEVFRGDESLLQKPYATAPVPSVEAALDVRRVTLLVQAQLRRDLEAVREDLAPAALAEAERAALSAQADALARRVEDLPPVAAEGFRAVVPMTDLEREIFRLQAAAWRARKHPALRLWKTHRWDPLDASSEPSADAPPPVLEVRMMQNERRADVLNVTSARDAETTLRLRVEGLPGGAHPPCLTVHEVLTVGTKHFKAVSAALPLARRDGADWLVTAPVGMTRQVWLSIDSKDLAPGTHEGRVVLDNGGERRAVPLRLKVYPLRMPDPKTLRLGGWSYTDAPARYGVTPQNRDALIGYLRSRHVTSPWATSGALPPGTYDAEGRLAEKPDTRPFDEWVGRWPGAACYMVFGAVGDSFAGSKMGTDLFEKKVAAWIGFWAAHLRERGLRADQLAMLLVDEPGSKDQYDVITAWARVIQRAAPEVLVWEDACPRDLESCREMMAAVDVLVPNRSQWLGAEEPFRELFRGQRREGRQLGFYSCAGPARTFDPYAYYLLQQWQCFKEGATWSGFWAFADNAGASCWNDYVSRGNGPYCPLYLDETSVTPAKAMEAIAEGVQDYETLVMLRERIAAVEKAGRGSDALPRAKAVMAGACGRVLAGEKGANYRWDEAKDRTVADAARGEVLDALAALAGP